MATQKDDNEIPTLGGTLDSPCIALLDGLHERENEETETNRVTVPITCLPATLGRSHETSDEHFFGLGPKMALSRKQCQITYRDPTGGSVMWKDGKLQYQAAKSKKAAEKLPADLDSRGSFVMECLGKNRILVNDKLLEQGESAVLRSGSTVQISSYKLYFLLPQDAKPTVHRLEKPSSSAKSKPKKRTAPTVKLETAAQPPPAKKGKTTMGSNYQAELERLSTQELLHRMTQAFNQGLWERRHQLIGTTIALKCVRDAARDPIIQQEVVSNDGISRSDLMQWMEISPVYKEWVRQMGTKMEPRSYQAAVTKALLKAGYSRTSGSGRYIKWLLPDDISIHESVVEGENEKKQKEKEKIETADAGKGEDGGGSEGQENEEKGDEGGGSSEDASGLDANNGEEVDDDEEEEEEEEAEGGDSGGDNEVDVAGEEE